LKKKQKKIYFQQNFTKKGEILGKQWEGQKHGIADEGEAF
jgi:hypothetical protein